MHFFRKYPKFLKFTCFATISCGAGWLYYQVHTTKNILANALDASILNIVEPTVVEREDNGDFVIIDLPMGQERQSTSLSSMWNNLKFSFAKRLLVLTGSENKFVRKKAVRQLSKIQKLDSWQYSQLASMIDARTAVGLARTPKTNPQLFINPPKKFLGHTNEMVIDSMKELLVNLHVMSQHPCMGYFISKAFIDFDVLDKYPDECCSFELKKFIQNSNELLPLCLETLLHHASLGSYARDIATLNGLPLLMEIHNRFKENAVVSATISRIISYLSMHSELLNELYLSGWITVLSQWVKHDDVRISIPASKALANLDSEEDSVYLQRLYPLHPSTRSITDAGVDVVFVHGLLGGVFFTWRQRKRDQPILGFLGKPGAPESLTQHEDPNGTVCENINIDSQEPKKRISDPDVQEFMDNLEKQLSYESICTDYDVVWEDLPTKTNDAACGPFCSSGFQFVYQSRDSDDCFTNCWPRDWLAKDCDHLRIIGVNYETNLSLWAPMCPIEKVKTLEERSDELIQQLMRVGMGRRPIVWVAHSMGGLMVKCLLNKASESNNKKVNDIYSQTKGIVFYSTPHVGSTVAKFSQASAFVIWPSIEVQELQKHSPQLVEMHQNFLKVIKKNPIKIVTFVETEPTIVSSMKFKFLVVEPDSGNPGYGEYYEIPLDHLGICKPASRYSFLYQKVLQLIREILTEDAET